MDTQPMRALSGVFANGAAGKIKSCRLAITLAKCESTG